jgi:hypothetical protein
MGDPFFFMQCNPSFYLIQSTMESGSIIFFLSPFCTISYSSTPTAGLSGVLMDVIMHIVFWRG